MNSKWLNVKTKIHSFDKIEKPCHTCGFCPYGQLVEEFPLDRKDYACQVFGHDCPVFYHGEFLSEKLR